MKIVNIITGLGDGGAEHTLFKICKYDKINEHIVISLKDSGKYFSLIKKLGVKVYCLNFKYYSINKFLFLIKLISSIKPDLVQTLLIHADLIGGLASKLAGVKKIIWNVRYSNFEIGKAKFQTIVIIKILAKISSMLPSRIVINSKKAKKLYIKIGYDKKKLNFIPNGFDLSLLKIKKSEKISFRKKNKIKKFTPLIGNVARYDPQKDHFNLLKALHLIRSNNIDFYCVLVGTNIDKNNFKIVSEIKKLNLTNYVKLLGQTDNILSVMNGIDIYVQSSRYGEGFPNVVAEAMACATPSVVTDVGDASLIVGKTGWVVPPNNPYKLASAIKKSINEFKNKNWSQRCNKARFVVKENFGINKMIKSYNSLWNRS